MTDERDGEWVAQRLARWRESREPEALGELLKWQRHRAYAIALRILDRGADAEDAVQQAFIKMLTRTHGFNDAEDFKVAVYRAVVQCALNLLQSNRSRGNAEKVMSHGNLNLSDSPPSPATVAENAEALQMVRTELSAMNPEDRALVVLCCQEGLSVSAASEVLSVKRETVRDRLGRALTELRGRLSKRGLSLSLLLLLGLLQEGGAANAPASLCAALDKTLPGSGCSSIPADAVTRRAAGKILADAGVQGSALTAKVAVLSITVLLALGAIGIISAIKIRMSPGTPIPIESNKENANGSAAPVAGGGTNNVTPFISTQGVSAPGGPVEPQEISQIAVPGDTLPGAKTEEQLKEEAKMRNAFKALVAGGALAAAMNSGWAGDGNPGPGGMLVQQGNPYAPTNVQAAPAKPDADAATIKAAAKKAAAQIGQYLRREGGESNSR